MVSGQTTSPYVVGAFTLSNSGSGTNPSLMLELEPEVVLDATDNESHIT